MVFRPLLYFGAKSSWCKNGCIVKTAGYESKHLKNFINESAGVTKGVLWRIIQGGKSGYLRVFFWADGHNTRRVMYKVYHSVMSGSVNGDDLCMFQREA